MDKRSEPRFEADQLVAITTLGETQFRQTARVKNASGSGLGLIVEAEIPPGTVLRIEWENAFLLGEAMYSRRLEKGFFVGVQLEQMLSGLRELRERFSDFYEEAEDPIKAR